jgi:hypothetical protein
MPERDDRQRVMEQMEEERDQRERRAMRSAGYGEDGPGGLGRLPLDRGGDRLRRDWDQGGRGGPGAAPGPSPGSPPRGGERQQSQRSGGGERSGGGASTPDHRGRGPKGYRRSDERILEDVNDRLTEDPRVDASEIQVDVQGGEVTLTGTVGSREERRRAEDVAEGASGVTYVMNNLRVRQPGGSGATG